MSKDRLARINKILDGNGDILSSITSGMIKRLPGGELTAPGVQVCSVYINQNFNMIIGSYAKGSSWPSHTHNRSIQHLICTKGEFEVDMDTISGTLRHLMKCGDSVLVPAETMHSVIALEDGELIGVCIPPEPEYERPREHQQERS